MATTNILHRVRANTFLLVTLVAAVTFIISGMAPSKAHATPSNNCWATVVQGASRLYGGCKGNVGGTTFQVVAKCG